MLIQQFPVRPLYGIEVRASVLSRDEIFSLWKHFEEENIADQIPARVDGRLIAAYHSYEENNFRTCSHFLGCEVIDVPCAADGFCLREIPAGEYAVFQARGEMPLALLDTWTQINDLELCRNFSLDFEVYDPAIPGQVQIFVGIHSKFAILR
ncbi:GyrI-like domain-containing protein [Rubinisphaera margarita]|uniref:GyrI-like domain-containing protein n=1 Tax=Rubinisphaera margarita TaxID=2909586 RepID=UPI001EE9325D|nr:GyrI-like domain-containing protein [Rubinisphaera margarita]MCG6158104.1 GyrI-like domain-containing protein [Rubinisphaera margarita]